MANLGPITILNRSQIDEISQCIDEATEAPGVLDIEDFDEPVGVSR